MKTNRSAKSGALPGVPDGEVTRLAERAISILLSRSEARRVAADAQMLLLCDAFLSDEDEARRAIMNRLRQDGTGVTAITDDLIPELARYMGQRWADDEIGFADVTIGSARLQEAVRALGRSGGEFRAPGLSGDAGRVLLIIPRSEHHTLGTFVAADQFRRLGFHVDVALDQHPREVGERVLRKRYDMIGISAAGRRTLASAKELVEIIRGSVTRVTPIVLSGSIVTRGNNLKDYTGVDHVVTDVESAVRLCGLDIPREVRSDVSA